MFFDFNYSVRDSDRRAQSYIRSTFYIHITHTMEY